MDGIFPGFKLASSKIFSRPGLLQDGLVKSKLQGLILPVHTILFFQYFIPSIISFPSIFYPPAEPEAPVKA